MQMLYGNKNLTSTNNREGVTKSSLCLQITVNAQNEKDKDKFPLFTLGSIYSTNASTNTWNKQDAVGAYIWAWS